MAEREWKPGDVAMVTLARREPTSEPTAYLAFHSGDNYGGWRGVLNGKGVGSLTDNEDAFTIERRPLVVIDPEDAEQIKQLTAAWEKVTHADLDCAAAMTLAALRMREALRGLIAPPKTEVFEHLPVRYSGDTIHAYCGKSWKPGGDVTVAGRCPECTEFADTGWRA